MLVTVVCIALSMVCVFEIIPMIYFRDVIMLNIFHRRNKKKASYTKAKLFCLRIGHYLLILRCNISKIVAAVFGYSINNDLTWQKIMLLWLHKILWFYPSQFNFTDVRLVFLEVCKIRLIKMAFYLKTF